MPNKTDSSLLPPIQSAPSTPPTQSGVGLEVPMPMQPTMGPTSKEYAIAGGAVLVAAIIWFAVKNAYGNWLVSAQRKSPNTGSAAGWALFGTLLFPTIAGALGILDSTRFLSLPYSIPVGLATVVCLALTIILSTRK